MFPAATVREHWKRISKKIKMANELGQSCLDKESFPQIAELVEMVLKLLPEKHLVVASKVCKLWRRTAEKLRVSRRYTVTCLVEEIQHPLDLIPPTVRFIEELYFEPSAVILFANFYPMHNFFIPKRILQELHKNRLSKRCAVVGCTGRPVIGSTFSNVSGECLQTDETGKRKCLSLLFVPRIADIHVRSFYIPLKNRYKKIRGVRAFLPEMKDVKLVIVFAHPLSLGKLTHLAVAIREKYGDGVTLVGGYSDTFLFYSNEVTSNEIVGLVFSGNLQATSVVIENNHSNTAANLKSTSQAVKRLQNCGFGKKNSFGLVFTCSMEENVMNISRDQWYIDFCPNFPDTPLVGFAGTAAFGCDMELLKMHKCKPGGRNFLQRNSTVLCLCSMENHSLPLYKDD